MIIETDTVVDRTKTISALTLLLCLLLPFAASADGRLWRAIDSGDEGAVKTLLTKRVDVNAKRDGNPALYEALVKRHLGIAKRLINAGADPNGTNKFGAPVLLTAAGSGDIEIVKLLIKKGAKVNAKFERYDDVTALMLAAESGHLEVVKALIKGGADVDVRTANGDTALIAAVAKGHVDIIKLLLKEGADVNGRSESGYTALFIAVSDGSDDLVELLLAKGADPNVQDDSGVTPLELARRNRHAVLVEMLEAAGARP